MVAGYISNHIYSVATSPCCTDGGCERGDFGLIIEDGVFFEDFDRHVAEGLMRADIVIPLSGTSLFI